MPGKGKGTQSQGGDEEELVSLANIMAAIKQQTSDTAALSAKFDGLTERVTSLEARSRSRLRPTEPTALFPTPPPPATVTKKDTEQEEALQHSQSNYKAYQSPIITDEWEENDVLQEMEQEVELPQLLPQLLPQNTRVKRADQLKTSRNGVKLIDKSWTTLFCTTVGPPFAVSYWPWISTPGLSSGAPLVAPVSLDWAAVNLIGQCDVWLDGYDYG